MFLNKIVIGKEREPMSFKTYPTHTCYEKPLTASHRGYRMQNEIERLAVDGWCCFLMDEDAGEGSRWRQ